jgi:hypothetical protein
MSVVVPRYHCRFGNNISQYVWPRLVAEHLGFSFSAPPLLKLPTKLPGASYDSPVENVSDFNDVVVDKHKVLNNNKPRQLMMMGHFQQADKYSANRLRIQDWFRFFNPEPVKLPSEYDEDADVVAHLRLADYVGLGWNLPLDYYRKAIREIGGCRRLWVCTDDARAAQSYLRALTPCCKVGAFLVECGDGLREFGLIMHAKRKIISNSTFSWWAAFLGEPAPSYGHVAGDVVVYPHNWQPWGVGQPGDRHHRPGTVYPSDFRMDAPGWTMIGCAGMEPWTP